MEKQNKNIEEQASGFPPFTRGYEVYNFQTVCIEDDDKLKFDFELTEISNQALSKVFHKILNSHTRKVEIHILILAPFNEEIIIATKVLRTLLSLVNLESSNNASSSKFIFYTKNKHLNNIQLDYHFATASQIQFLIASEKNKNYLSLLPSHPEPIDPSYGNENIEESVSYLVSEIWKKTRSSIKK